jgi:hypothetical protein
VVTYSCASFPFLCTLQQPPHISTLTHQFSYVLPPFSHSNPSSAMASRFLCSGIVFGKTLECWSRGPLSCCRCSSTTGTTPLHAACITQVCRSLALLHFLAGIQSTLAVAARFHRVICGNTLVLVQKYVAPILVSAAGILASRDRSRARPAGTGHGRTFPSTASLPTIQVHRPTSCVVGSLVVWDPFLSPWPLPLTARHFHHIISDLLPAWTIPSAVCTTCCRYFTDDNLRTLAQL